MRPDAAPAGHYKLSTCALVLPAVLLLGCAQLSPQDAANLEYGEPPANYEQRVKSWFRFRDPYSAVWNIGSPRKAYYFAGVGKPVPGWIVPVTVNAKAVTGGYAGEESHRFFFHGAEMERIDPTVPNRHHEAG